jgi:hypothetical protein
MRKIQKPEWLIFAEKCRAERMPTLKFGKSPRRGEDTLRRWWLEAQREHAYPGTPDDWFYLMGYHR